MAYYIDETGKRGLKAEGGQFFVWSKETRKFSVPVDDAPPKSRMLRCSEYDAKFFNFKSDPADWPTELNRLSDVLFGRNDAIAKQDGLSLDDAIKCKEETDRFIAEQMPAVKSALRATWEYGVDGGDCGKIAEGLMSLLETERDLAADSVELAKCRAEIEKCADCPFAQTGNGPKLCEDCDMHSNQGMKE